MFSNFSTFWYVEVIPNLLFRSTISISKTLTMFSGFRFLSNPHMSLKAFLSHTKTIVCFKMFAFRNALVDRKFTLILAQKTIMSILAIYGYPSQIDLYVLHKWILSQNCLWNVFFHAHDLHYWPDFDKLNLYMAYLSYLLIIHFISKLIHRTLVI